MPTDGRWPATAGRGRQTRSPPKRRSGQGAPRSGPGTHARRSGSRRWPGSRSAEVMSSRAGVAPDCAGDLPEEPPTCRISGHERARDHGDRHGTPVRTRPVGGPRSGEGVDPVGIGPQVAQPPRQPMIERAAAAPRPGPVRGRVPPASPRRPGACGSRSDGRAPSADLIEGSSPSSATRLRATARTRSGRARRRCRQHLVGPARTLRWRRRRSNPGAVPRGDADRPARVRSTPDRSSG